MTRIETAAAADFAQVLAIYNEVIRNTTAVYQEEEYTVERGKVWFDAKLGGGYPCIVAHDASGVIGFGSCGAFRAWPCYSRSVEHSVHVRADRRGCGVGRALVVELQSRAAAMRMHVMIAGIDAGNIASIRLHEKLGFAHAGRFHEVGFKFGRWLDLLFLQCILPPTEVG